MNWKKLRTPDRNLDFESMDELGKVSSVLSFTAENKIGNLHKIRLFTF